MNTTWYHSALGRLSVQTEAQLLVQALDDVFGPVLVQCGAWGLRGELLQSTPTRTHHVVAQQPDDAVNLVARLAQLPLASATADAVLLPHALEFERDPYAVLREADRILMGEGRLIVLGYRPASPWGWRAAASQNGFPPGLLRLLPESRVRDWLVLLGYEVECVRYYLYTLPFRSKATAPSEVSVRRGWVYPLPAGGFLLKARKRLYGITPTRARRRRMVMSGALEPTTRGIAHE